ncbi:MAG: pyridoxine 5'-phosphate synthase [Gammaproteobacteria bacterium]
MKPILLGVNVDHVATLRQARGVDYPDPVKAALIAEQAGADGITMHLREDRRHIIDKDVFNAQSQIQTRLNFEMAVTEEMISIAEKLKPAHCCLVPEKREEVTTEGGLNVADQFEKIKQAATRLGEAGIEVSLFIDPDPEQIDAAIASQAPTIEIHTGCYANATTPESVAKELARIVAASQRAHEGGLIVNGGHGLHYENVQKIAAIPEMNELNIGHSIVAHAAYVGMAQAVKEMKALMSEVRAE